MSRQPFISIIIPVHNGSKYLNQCLDALLASSYKSYEIIVVDDASTDDSVEISRKKGATVFRLPRQSGPGGARNYGAGKAQGDILFFVDSDVVVQQDTVARVAADFTNNPNTAAVFGSYDDSPIVPDFLSQFRNLLHHFTHQNSREEAVTFWAGCGAVRRDIFHEVGGFNQDKYPKPSIEDIELGYRLRKAGYRIMLDKGLQAKHLKNWEWRSMLKTDIFNRAVPWSQLILESRSLPSDLNLQTSHRLSAALVGLLFLILPLILLSPLIFSSIAVGGVLFTVFLFLILVLLLLNRNLYAFLYRKRGMKFMVLAIPVHFLYYFYSGVSFGVCWIIHKFSALRPGSRKVRALSQ